MNDFLSDVDFKYVVVNALAFYAQFHTSPIEEVELKFWRECYDADVADLKQNHQLSVDSTASKIANYFPLKNDNSFES